MTKIQEPYRMGKFKKYSPKRGPKNEFCIRFKGPEKLKMKSKSTQTDNTVTGYHIINHSNKGESSIQTRARRSESAKEIKSVKGGITNDDLFCELCKVSLELSLVTLLEHLNAVHFRPQWGCDTLQLYKKNM